jgi:phosphatidyl-myo-inositol dimannoside synthase
LDSNSGKTDEEHAMRIIVLVPSLVDATGGIQTYSQAMVASLCRLAVRHEWTVYVIALNDRPIQSLPSFGDPSLAGYSSVGGNKGMFILRSIQQVIHADVVIMAHVNFAKLVPLFKIFAPDASLVVAMHGIEVWKRLGWWTQFSLRCVDELWPVTRFTQVEVVRRNPSLGRVASHVLFNTLGPLYAPTDDSDRSASSPVRPMILCVSRMAPTERDKNIDVLIRAMPLVVREVPDASLTLVGPDDGAKWLKDLVNDLRLAETVSFPGHVGTDELSGFYKDCALFALPSTKEGFGIVFLEAMYFAKACVGADAGGVPEVIEDGVTGIIVKVLTPEAMAAALIRLLKDDHLCQQMGSAGRKRLEDMFANSRFEERIEDRMQNLQTRRG